MRLPVSCVRAERDPVALVLALAALDGLGTTDRRHV